LFSRERFVGVVMVQAAGHFAGGKQSQLVNIRRGREGLGLEREGPGLGTA